MRVGDSFGEERRGTPWMTGFHRRYDHVNHVLKFSIWLRRRCIVRPLQRDLATVPASVNGAVQTNHGPAYRTVQPFPSHVTGTTRSPSLKRDSHVFLVEKTKKNKKNVPSLLTLNSLRLNMHEGVAAPTYAENGSCIHDVDTLRDATPFLARFISQISVRR